MNWNVITIYAKYNNGTYFFGFTNMGMFNELKKRGYKLTKIEDVDGETVLTMNKIKLR